MLKLQIFIGEIIPFNAWILIYRFSFSISSVSIFCFIAKERIDSGFFLFEADQKKKEEKQEKLEETKRVHGIIG